MGVVKMNRFTLVGLLHEQDAVINSLSKLGAVDIRADVEKTDYWQKKAQHNRQLIQTLQEERQLLENTIPAASELLARKQSAFGGKRSISIQDFMSFDDEAKQKKLLDLAKNLQKNRQVYAEKQAKLTAARLQAEVLRPWQNALGTNQVGNTRRTHQWLGRVNNLEQFKILQSNLEGNFAVAVVNLLNNDPKQVVYVLLASPASSGEQVLLKAQQFGFQQLQQKTARLTPQEELVHCNKKIKNLSDELEALQTAAIDLASNANVWEELSDYLQVKIDKLLAGDKVKTSERLFVIQGYIPAHLAKGTAKGLEETYCVSIDLAEVDKSSDYPILLANSSLTKPYEAVIDMFSLPNAAEVDPTSAVAPFYCLFFGMMFSDVAYGLIFCVLTAFLVYKVKVQGGLLKMCKMFFQCGLSSIVWGLLFGGFFGNLIDAFAGTADGATKIFPALWFDPMAEPTKMMVWSVIFGAIHIFVGMAVKIKILLATGKTKEAILDVCPWYLIIAGLGAMGYGVTGNNLLVKDIGSYMAIFGAIVILLFAGRSSKNPILRIFKGLGSLYDITGYFSDIMSYTRILALALSTAVIAMVVNLLALLPGKNSIIGFLFFVVIAILGHTLNFALSALSAYVHTTRLHYVEFFGKFYEGGGRAFQPLAYRTKYVQIDSNADEPRPITESLKKRFSRFKIGMAN